jgi:selenoprotein W-related protein
VAPRPGTGGVFEIRVDGETLWSRQAEGGFPDLPKLKRLVCGRVAPGKQLGHTER